MKRKRYPLLPYVKVDNKHTSVLMFEHWFHFRKLNGYSMRSLHLAAVIYSALRSEKNIKYRTIDNNTITKESALQWYKHFNGSKKDFEIAWNELVTTDFITYHNDKNGRNFVQMMSRKEWSRWCYNNNINFYVR